MNNKTPPNTPALQSLKAQNWKIKISHFRRKAWKDNKEPLIAEKAYREVFEKWPLAYDWNSDISQTGGATELVLDNGEQTITIRADCYVKDNFNKRIGTKVCLEKLEKLYNIK